MSIFLTAFHDRIVDVNPKDIQIHSSYSHDLTVLPEVV
jgi:hypothetical protein